MSASGSIVHLDITPQSVADALMYIAPKWAKKIEAEKITWQKNSKLKLSDAETCIVGEAYGFSNKYNCPKLIRLDKGRLKDNPDYCKRCSEGGQNMFEEACPISYHETKPCNAYPEFLKATMTFAKHFKRSHKELIKE